MMEKLKQKHTQIKLNATAVIYYISESELVQGWCNILPNLTLMHISAYMYTNSRIRLCSTV